jgi:hypothetical protein
VRYVIDPTRKAIKKSIEMSLSSLKRMKRLEDRREILRSGEGIGERPPSHANEHEQRGLSAKRAGKSIKAEKMHRETLALEEKVSGKERPHTPTTMSNVARVLNE